MRKRPRIFRLLNKELCMEYFELFGEYYPELKLNREIFGQLLDIGGCTAFEHKENGDIVGFAVVKDNSLRLICVSEKYRRQGIGSELLAQAEEHIGKEHNEVILGGASGLFIGAPVSKENFDKRSFPFFEKRGYAFDDGCAEMELLLDDFSASEHDLPVAGNVTFGYIDGTSEALKKAVEETVPDWVQYFGGSKVFCGFCGGEIASFCITEEWEPSVVSDGVHRTGAVGCVGTVPRFRRQGIGLKMVALAAEELKKQGFGKCFIHHTGVYDWYEKIGCRTVLWELFGKKALS